MDEFEKLMQSYAGQRVCVINITGGNAGDKLILMGLRKMLDRLGVDYTIRDLDFRIFTLRVDALFPGLFDFDGYDLVLMRGGGHFNDVWPTGMRILNKVINKSKETVVAPHSFWLRRSCIWDTLRPKNRVTIFTRERYSYEYLRGTQLPKDVCIGLAPDSAFYLTQDDFNLPGCDERVGTLLCFREDTETVMSTKRLKMLYDLHPSTVFVDLGKKPYEQYVSTVARSCIIHTDRLHVGILGAKLGSYVYLYPNAYWKNRGVYEYSMSDLINVTFVDGD